MSAAVYDKPALLLPFYNFNIYTTTIKINKIFFRIMIIISELILYVHVYENYRITALPWDSPWTWLLCFLVVDWTYYWFHRAAHGLFQFLQFIFIHINILIYIYKSLQICMFIYLFIYLFVCVCVCVCVFVLIVMITRGLLQWLKKHRFSHVLHGEGDLYIF